ncbi:MAG: replication-relaxation family protein [Candidatus Delongbacteria bacterium]|nr:replication-relaxation family protein [Candidatus Delongbacteria bacterium]
MRELRITRNQIEIIKLIHSFRYLPFKALLYICKEKGIYRHKSNLSKIISKLEKDNILNSFLYGNNWKVVYLTAKGGKILSSLLNIPKSALFIPNQRRKYYFSLLEHTLKIVEIYINFLNDLKHHPQVKLVKWLGDQQCNLAYQFRVNKTGKLTKRELSPDSYFEIEVQNGTWSYFLEYDTGTMDKEQLARKFCKYFEYFVYGNWKDKFEYFPSIIFLTERSEYSLLNLIQSETIKHDTALLNRNNFIKSNHVIWKAIGLTDNLKSISAENIKKFLSLSISFQRNYPNWAETILKQYP